MDEANNVIQVTTASGFTCTIRQDLMDDWKLAKLASRASKDPAAALELVVYMCDEILSPEDAARLEEHVMVDGRVPTSSMMAEFNSICEAVGAAKK